MDGHEQYLEQLSRTDKETEAMDERIVNKLEDADAQFVLCFMAEGEIVKKITGYDLDSVLEQSRKLDGADWEWAQDEINGQDADPEPY
jgi:hypothetical protein